MRKDVQLHPTPANGSLVIVSPGEAVRLEFEVKNEDTEYSALLQLVVKTDLSAEWYATPKGRRTRPGGTELLAIEFHVPSGAQAQVWPVEVVATDTEGNEVRSFGKRDFLVSIAAEVEPDTGEDVIDDELREKERKKREQAEREERERERQRQQRENPFGYVADEPVPVGHIKEIDPIDRVVTVNGNDRIYLRFNRVNTGSSEARLALHDIEERTPGSATRGWYVQMQDQNVLPAGQKGFVSCGIKVPEHIEPGQYLVRLTVGFDSTDSEPQLIRIKIRVREKVGVTIKASPKTVTLNPFQKETTFTVIAEAASNAASAVRLSVRDPKPNMDSQGRIMGSGDCAVIGAWRTNLANEIGDVHPQLKGPGVPVKEKLTVRRQGIWWLGWVEKVPIRLRAVPVTDESNGGVPGNETVVQIKRWRILPWPWFVNVLFIVAYALSGPVDVTVTNGLRVETTNLYVVIPSNNKDYQTGTAEATVQLETHPWRPLVIRTIEDKLSDSEKKRTWKSPDSVSLIRNEYARHFRYDAQVPFLQSNQTIALVIPGRGRGSLRVSGATLESRARVNFPSLTPAPEGNDDAPYLVTYLARPRSPIAIENFNSNYKVSFAIFRRPDPSVLIPKGLGADYLQGANAKPTQGSAEGLRFYFDFAKGVSSCEGQELWMVTNDKAQQIICIRFSDDGPAATTTPTTTIKSEPIQSGSNESSEDKALAQIKARALKNIDGLSDEELRIYRNEPYARHGAVFSTQRLQMFFSKTSWYRSRNLSPESVYSDFSRGEKEQISSAREEEERRMRGR